MEQEQNMSYLIEEEHQNEYAKVGRTYVKEINKIAVPDKSYLFETLDCMQLEEGYSLGLRLSEKKAWEMNHGSLPIEKIEIRKSILAIWGLLQRISRIVYK